MGVLPGRQSNWGTILFDSGVHRSSWINFILVDEITIRISRSGWFYDIGTLLSICNNARNDNGSLFLDGIIPRRFWKLSHTAHGGSQRHGVPICEYAEFLDVLRGSHGADGQFLCSGWTNRCRMDIVSTTGHSRRNTRFRVWNIINAYITCSIRDRIHNGWVELHNNNFTSEDKRHDSYEDAINDLGDLHSHNFSNVGLPRSIGQFSYDDVG